MDTKYAREKDFCNKWLPVLERIEGNENLKEKCKKYNPFIPSKENDELADEIGFSSFIKEAYESGVVISNYQAIIKEQKLIFDPTDEFAKSLSELEVIACIAWLFRLDHFNEGSLINESFPSGAMLTYFRALIGSL